MNAIKKLLVATIGVLLITFGCGSTVNATETVNLEDIAATLSSETDEETVVEAATLTGNDNIENTENSQNEVVTNEVLSSENIYNEEITGENATDDEDETLTADDKEIVELLEEEFDASENADAVPEDEEAEIEEEEAEEKSEDIGKAKSTKNKAEEKPSYSESDLRLLACLVYAEAGNQPYEGMLAVANVVLNRVKSPVFSHANTIEEVIYDNKWCVQFSVTAKSSKTGKSILDKVLEFYDTGVYPGKNSQTAKKNLKRAIKAAKAALCGENNIGDFLYFRMKNSKAAANIKKKYEYKIIGDHIFYSTKKK